MYKLSLIVFLTAFILSCEGASDIDDSSCLIVQENAINKTNSNDVLLVANKAFNTGGGIGGNVIRFKGDGTFTTFSFCDICSGGGSIGTYTQKSKAIYMLDSLCFVNRPHFTDSSVFIDCENSTMTTYYLIGTKEGLFLSNNSKDTLFPESVEIDFSFPSYNFSKELFGNTTNTFHN